MSASPSPAAIWHTATMPTGDDLQSTLYIKISFMWGCIIYVYSSQSLLYLKKQAVARKRTIAYMNGPPRASSFRPVLFSRLEMHIVNVNATLPHLIIGDNSIFKFNITWTQPPPARCYYRWHCCQPCFATQRDKAYGTVRKLDKAIIISCVMTIWWRYGGLPEHLG